MVSEAESSNPNLDAWREQVHLSALPVFARTVRDVGLVANSVASSAGDLSQVVGKDPGLTTKVVRIANSPIFNLQNRSVASIPEAVVLIGFDSIKDLAVSVTVLEEFRKGRSPERVGSLMAQGFHTATQARYLAGQLSDTPLDEVFLAGLLQDLGAMAFWAHGEAESEALEQALTRSPLGEDAETVEEQVLGFSLNELSLALVDEWKLGKLLGRSLSVPTEEYAGVFEKGKKLKDARLTSICTGRVLARAVEQEALDEPEALALLETQSEPDRGVTHNPAST